MGKGCKRRPTLIGKEESDLRWKLFTGAITFDEFEIRYKKLLAGGKILRSGKIIKCREKRY